MITIKRIRTTHVEHYDFVEKLLVSAFPREERRELELQRDHTDEHPLFYNNIIFHDNVPVGFITYWDFDDFYYIEHFAIAPEARNGGFGHKVLKYIDDKLTKPIVLEVEVPIDEMSIRRIGFYSRLGYKLWERKYLQPPYRKGDEYIPMYLMVKGDLDSTKDFERIKQKLYSKVYKVENA